MAAARARALVTGCNGFVGRDLAKSLHEDGWIVLGLDRAEEPWADWIDYGRVDLADERGLEGFLAARKAEVVFNLAAVANPVAADGDPIQAIRANVLGPALLFEACRRKLVSRLLVVGSAEEYRVSTSHARATDGGRRA